jgi:dihydrofolate reductase
MHISQIVVVAENGVIGADGGMPWHLSSDLARFKALTMGKPMVMGRKTFESIGKVLPGRTSIVVTRDKTWQVPGAVAVSSVEEALELAETLVRDAGGEGYCIVGGGEIYRQTRKAATRMDITRVHASPEGDTIFEPPQEPKWHLKTSKDVPAGEKDSAATTYQVWLRR